MKILIFDWSVSGHHLEYLHHLYMGALQHRQHSYIFLLPKAFENAKTKFVWPDAKHITIQYLSEAELRRSNKPQLLISAWHKSIIVRNAVKRNAIDSVWLISLMHLMPFLPWVLPNRVQIQGILYRIYFYEGSTIHGVRLLLERLRYRLMIASRNLVRILVLNDQSATDKLNESYRTSKFFYLPDPIPEIDDSKVRDIRSEIGAVEKDCIYLHFGALDERKGTLEILKAIQMMSAESLKDKVFVFAGVIHSEIKNKFYTLLEAVKKKAHIIVFDEFCSYEHLYNLCYSCDCILIPYQNTNQSSGVIGVAAHFKKPVIGPNKGLLGKLIIEYNLGGAYNNINAIGLKEIINSGKITPCSGKYSKTHTVNLFTKSFL